MRAMTAANLRSAFGGESMAHMRCQIWGDCAEKDDMTEPLDMPWRPPEWPGPLASIPALAS